MKTSGQTLSWSHLASIVRLALVVTLSAQLAGCARQTPQTHLRKGFYVAPRSVSRADGSARHPWDLATALQQPAKVHAGDTIWLTTGRYAGIFESRLAGTVEKPIVVRAYPGEQVTIDGPLTVRGSHAVYRDFEVTNSVTLRKTGEAGSDPGSYKRRAGIDIHGQHTSFINLVVHDAGGGFGIWSDAKDSQIYGCIIYANGWQGPDRGHGHGIYGQNKTGVQRIAENVIFDQFGNGINLYGSDQAFLRNFALRGNVAFDNGAISTERSAIDILVGGGTPASGITVEQNFTYRSDGLLTARFGYDAGVINDDITLTDNYFVGGTQLMNWQRANVKRNTFTGAPNVLQVTTPPGTAIRAYQWDNSAYEPDLRRHAMNSDMPIVLVSEGQGAGHDLATWQRATGRDSAGTTAAAPSGAKVFVRPNAYDTTRANVIVYNWSAAPHVDVDARAILRAGDRYEVRTVTDYFGEPVLSGVFDGRSIQLPMRTQRVLRTVGTTASRPAAMGSEFGVFILIKR